MPPSSSSLTQPRRTDCQSSFPPNSKAVPGSQSFVPPRLTEDELYWLQKIRIFPDFPGLLSQEPTKCTFLVGFARGGTQHREPPSPYPLGLGQEAAGLQLGWDGTELVPLVCPPAPLASTEQVSPSPPKWLPKNSRTIPLAPGSYLAPLC